MNITVKYFASLREQLGKSEEHMVLESSLSVADLWQRISGRTTLEDVLAAINMEYVTSDTMLNDGDELAFFPPVTGG